MKTAVIVFPGSNCDRDLAESLAAVSGQACLRLWHLVAGKNYGDRKEFWRTAQISAARRATLLLAEPPGPTLPHMGKRGG